MSQKTEEYLKMDWIKDFEILFLKYPEIRNLKETKFHGKLEINFCNGIPMNYNISQHRQAVKIDNQP